MTSYGEIRNQKSEVRSQKKKLGVLTDINF